MTTSRGRESRAEKVLTEDIIKELEFTAEQVQKLLEEIRNSKINFATINVELKFLVENVSELSSIIKDGDGCGILTRLALIEQCISEVKLREKNDEALKIKIALLEQKVDIIASAIKKEEDNVIKVRANNEGRWRLYIAIASGAFAVIGAIIALIMNLSN